MICYGRQVYMADSLRTCNELRSEEKKWTQKTIKDLYDGVFSARSAGCSWPRAIGCSGASPSRGRMQACSRELIIYPAHMAYGDRCLSSGWGDRVFSILLYDKSDERGHRFKIQKNEDRTLS